MYPVKILDDLYVFGIIGSNKSEREEFLKLDFFEKIEQLVSRTPLARKVRVSGTDFEFYTSAFGEFIVSSNKSAYVKEQNEEFTQKKSEELFSKFEEDIPENGWFGQSNERIYLCEKNTLN